MVGVGSVLHPIESRFHRWLVCSHSFYGDAVLGERNSPATRRGWLAIGNDPRVVVNDGEVGGVGDGYLISHILIADVFLEAECGILCGFKKYGRRLHAHQIVSMVDPVFVGGA